MAKTKKKVKPEVQDIKLEDLEQAVDEVNTQLDLDPGIEKGSDVHMRKELKEAMTDEDLFEGDEEFTSGTYDVLEALGIEHDCVKVKDVAVDKDENGGEEEEEVVITDVPPRKKQERTAKKENKKGETAMKTKVKTEKKRVKRIVSKKIIAKKKDIKKGESKEKKADVFGFKIDSKRGEMASLMSTGRYSKNEIQKKCNITYSLNKTIKALRENGHTIIVDDKGKVTLK